MLTEINRVLDEKIRPYLNEHYGDVKIISAMDGEVKIKLLGACGNCPSANITVEEVIEARLKEEIKDIKKVTLVNEVSEDLIDMARKILNH